MGLMCVYVMALQYVLHTLGVFAAVLYGWGVWQAERGGGREGVLCVPAPCGFGGPVTLSWKVCFDLNIPSPSSFCQEFSSKVFGR